MVLLGNAVCSGLVGLDGEGDRAVQAGRVCRRWGCVYQRDRCEEEGAGLAGEGRRAEDVGALGARGCGPVSSLSAAPRRFPVSWAGEQVGPGRNAGVRPAGATS